MQSQLTNSEIVGIMIFAGVIMLAIYLLPMIVALIRRHNNWLAISLLNIFVGWTFFAWVVLLIWASLKTKPVTVIMRRSPGA